jgi:CheY-like chemotaxis protein
VDRKVMIVDHDSQVRFAVRKLLERAGTKVVEADGGRDCLEQLRQGFRGLVLMEILMPEMDGWDTIRQIVDKGYDLGNIVLVLTALDSPGEQLEDLQNHVVDYITKPFEPDDLLATCQMYLAYSERLKSIGGES